MERYSRVPTGNESSTDTHVDSRDVGGGSSFPIEGINPSRTNRKLKRRGSHRKSQSSGSYTSVESNEGNSLSNRSDDDDDNNGLCSLNNIRSFASNDGLAAIDDGLLSEGSTAVSRSASSKAGYPSIYSGSFDLDDEDDDDVVLEANLKRYNLDFSSPEKVTSLANDDINDGNPFARGTGSTNHCSRIARFLWFSFQSVRQQARQRRAQLLLQQTDRNWRQSLKMCIITNCDATDSGILLVAAIMVVWILALHFVKDPSVRRGSFVIGIFFFVIRVGTRPLYQFYLRQRQKRQLRHQQLQQIPPSDIAMINPYDNDPLASSGGSLELQAMRGGSNTANRILATPVGSDPTVAAI